MNTKVLLIAVFIFPFAIAQGQVNNAIQIGPSLGFTPYESSMGLGVWGMYSRNLTRNFEVFIAGSSASGSYSTITPSYSYDNSEKVFALDLGGSFDLTPEKENNRLLFGIGGSWVQIQYDYGEFVYSDRVEMNHIRNSISMFLIKLEERYSFSSGFFLAANVTTRTCFGERKVLDRSITPSGTIGVSGGVRYFVNFGIGAGYSF